MESFRKKIIGLKALDIFQNFHHSGLIGLK